MPWVTYALVAINVVIFMYELLLGPAVDQFLMARGAVPAYITDPASHPLAFVTLFTSMFLMKKQIPGGHRGVGISGPLAEEAPSPITQKEVMDL